jgi:2-polyprenyl-3-methyl-5-hydroxy-6-metoxy-1,4-benzoquinol methylase
MPPYGVSGIGDGKEYMNLPAGVAANDPETGYRRSPRPEVMALLPPLRVGLKVLEIGCGEGAFSVAVPGAIETWGIEPDQRSAAIAKTKLTKVFANTFDATKAELPRDYFDLVVCNDVIEHMTDHDAFLLSIQDHMAPGAYLVGSLPNVRFYANLFNLFFAGDWHYQNAGILDRTHFRFFTFRSVRRSLEEARLDVRRIDGLNPGTPTRWDVRALVERLFRRTLLVMSGGAARDIRYLQIGFLAMSRR